MNLVVYPTFGQLFTPVSKTFVLPKEADLNSLVFHPLINYQIVPKEGQVQVSKNGQAIQGQLIDVNDDTVTLLVKDRHIKIRAYDQIEYTDDTYFVAMEESTEPVTLNYIFSGASVEFQYHLNLTMGSLQQSASLNLPFPYAGSVTLMAGDVQMPQKAVYRGAMLSQVQDKPSISEVSEYKSIVIGERELRTGKNILSIDSYESINHRTVYTHNTDSQDVYFEYKFVAPGFLPQGQVYVYENELVIGKTLLKETQETQTVSLSMGKTSRILAETTVEDVPINEKERMIGLHIKLYNTTRDSIALWVEHDVGKANVSGISCKGAVRKENVLLFNVQLPPGSKVWSCSFHVKY